MEAEVEVGAAEVEVGADYLPGLTGLRHLHHVQVMILGRQCLYGIVWSWILFLLLYFWYCAMHVVNSA